MVKFTINNAVGQAQSCKGHNCFNWKFFKDANGTIICCECLSPYRLKEGEVEGPFPRLGKEFVDRFNDLPRYSFFRGQDGQGTVQRVSMRSGNWNEHDEVGKIMEEAQDEINSLRARLARLEPKMVS